MAFKNGTPKAVTTAGTAEPIVAGSTLASAVGFQAHRSNVGAIYIGGSDVTTGGSSLMALGTIGFTLNAAARPGAGGFVDLVETYVNADNATDRVEFWYIDGAAPAVLS